jgi:hypothetical protein
MNLLCKWQPLTSPSRTNTFGNSHTSIQPFEVRTLEETYYSTLVSTQ